MGAELRRRELEVAHAADRALHQKIAVASIGHALCVDRFVVEGHEEVAPPRVRLGFAIASLFGS
jgi:hypothetical protein